MILIKDETFTFALGMHVTVAVAREGVEVPVDTDDPGALFKPSGQAKH